MIVPVLKGVKEMEPWDRGSTKLPSVPARSRHPICKPDQDSKVRVKSQHEFGNGLISFYNRAVG